MSVVIVGAGQAGMQAAMSLRGDGYEGRITLIGDEPHPPYQRPPLSKAYLLGKQDADGLLLRPVSFYSDNRVDTLFGVRVREVDRAGRRVVLDSGEAIAFDHLILAAGARVRLLPVPGAEFEGIAYLRGRDDCDALRVRLARAERVVVVGGGYVGLEIAAAARGFGKAVTVVEIAPRLMIRTAAPEMSDLFADLHRHHGVEILLGAGVASVEGESGRVHAAITSDGRRLPADLVVVGIGVVPNIDLAQACGLACNNGIVVDAMLRTADPAIFAIGDCCIFPSVHAGQMMRLESVQNAVDQARAVAATIVGRGRPYDAVPWFWTDQYENKFQMAGLTCAYDRTLSRGDPQDLHYALFYFRNERLIAADCVNRSADYMAVRKIIGLGRAVTPEEIADPSVDLKTLAR